MIYFPYLIVSLIFTVFCYLTNWIVCFFADEKGELHGFLKYWQTWDDSLDPRFFVVGKVPSIFKYDYDKHYEEYEGTTPELEEVGRTRWFVRFKEGGEVFTTKERIQRYFCRVLWLMRNNSYGFAFWLLGRKIDPKNVVWKIDTKDTIFGHEIPFNILTSAWVYKTEKHLFWKLWLDIFIGWKFGPGNDHVHQAMIANRVWFSIED